MTTSSTEYVTRTRTARQDITSSKAESPETTAIMITPEIITLENVEHKLPQWQADAGQDLHAIVDMGSNGIRFSITSLAPPTTRLLLPVYSTRAGISLFDALTPSNGELVFPEETIKAVTDVLAGFYQLALSHNVPKENIMILATEAMRRAANAAEMLSSIANVTEGLSVRILEPSVETLCGAVMGSRSGLARVDEPGALFLDLGGGSVQMTWVDSQDKDYAIKAAASGFSLPYGAAKLQRILDCSDDEMKENEITSLNKGMQEGYERLRQRFPRLNQMHLEDVNVSVYMCGGGFRGYGSVLMHTDPVQPYPFRSVNTYSTPFEHFKNIDKMREVALVRNEKIRGLSDRRRTQFSAITTVIKSFMRAVPNIGVVTFCGGSNREGALMMKLPTQIRESNPLTVLVRVQDFEQSFFQAARVMIERALPSGVDFSGVPTALSTGLIELLIRETWQGRDVDVDKNSSSALLHATVRDPDCPGLSHQTRALLAVAMSARWGGNLSPSDHRLGQKLQEVLNRQAHDATYWALYVGGLLGLLGLLFPGQPPTAEALQDAISFDARIIDALEEGNYLSLEIILNEQYKHIISTEALEKFKQIMQTGKEEPPYKLKAVVIIQS